MSRDTDEELQRLQEALLQEEEKETAPVDDEPLPNIVTDDTYRIPDVGVYENFSNDYGKKLRNHATDYNAYNTDKTDTDLDEYSEAVLEEKRPTNLLWLPIVLLVVLSAVICALSWKYLRGIL